LQAAAQPEEGQDRLQQLLEGVRQLAGSCTLLLLVDESLAQQSLTTAQGGWAVDARTSELQTLFDQLTPGWARLRPLLFQCVT
jgi:hypothetical protein